MKIGELFLALGIKVDNAAITRVDSQLKGLRNVMLGISGAAVGAFYGLEKFISSGVNGVAQLKSLSEQTGVAVNTLRKWQQAAQLINPALGVDEISQSIANLGRTLAHYKLTGEGAQTFNLLGIDPNLSDNVEDLLEKIRERSQYYSKPIFADLLGQVGLSPALAEVFRTSKGDFDRLGAGSQLSEKSQRAALASAKAIRQLEISFANLKTQIAVALTPAFTNLINNFLKWLIDHKTQLVDVFVKIGEVVSNLSRSVFENTNRLAEFIERITGVKNGLLALATAFVAVNIAASPTLRILALLLGLLKVIDEFKNGGGEFFKGLKEKISNLLPFLNPLVEAFTKIAEAIKVISDFTGFTDFLKHAGEDLIGIAKHAASGLGKIGNIVVQAPLAAANLGRTGATIINNNIENNIHTSDDPDTLAAQVGMELNRVLMSTAQRNLTALQGGR